MNILNTIVEKAEGKDKAVLEEAINSIKEIDSLGTNTNTQNKEVDDIMNAFKENIQNIAKDK